MKKIELIALEEIPLINEGDNLVEVILIALEKNNISLDDGDILVIAQKIISKSEGRYAFLNEIKPSQEVVILRAILCYNMNIISISFIKCCICSMRLI